MSEINHEKTSRHRTYFKLLIHHHQHISALPLLRILLEEQPDLLWQMGRSPPLGSL